MDWYLQVLQKYTVFEGRARRKEYWFFVLFNLIITIVISVVESGIGTGGVLGIIYMLGVFLPSVAVAIRRLHDTDRSGWWLLISFIPVIGVIVLLVLLALDSTPGDNRFGPNPKGEGAASESLI